MADLGSDPISRAGDGHVGGRQRGVIGRGKAPVRRKARQIGVGQITRDQLAHAIKLFLRRDVLLRVFTGEQLLPTHFGSPSESAWAS